MRPPPRALSKPRPNDGRVPNPRTPNVVRAARIDLGDLVELFPTLPAAPKVRTAPKGLGMRVPPRRLPRGPR